MLVLSIPASPDRDDDLWLQQAIEFGNALFPPAGSYALELRAKRCGQDGHFEDNPPIGRIDSLLQNAEQKDLHFGSFFTPVNCNRTEEELGLELSAINGWSDLAVYMGIILARLKVSAWGTNLPVIHHALRQMVQYMQEMELTVSISAPDSILSDIQSMFPSHENPNTTPVGYEHTIVWEESDPVDIIQPRIHPIHTLCIQINTPIHPKKLDALLQTIDASFEKPLPALILFVENSALILSS
jgi:hypothetical protein